MIMQRFFYRAQCTRITSTFSALGLSLLATCASAHDFWIEPDIFRTAVGGKVSVSLRVGNDFKGDAGVFNPQYFERFVVIGPDGQRPVSGDLGDDPAGRFTIATPGPHTVGYFSKKFDVKFDAFDKFKEYLLQEGLERQMVVAEKRAAGGGPIREIYSRCAKALVAAPQWAVDGGEKRLGCPLELIAESNPTTQPDLKLRLLYLDKPLEGALVIAFNKASPQEKLKARSDREGRVQFKLTRPGVWLVTSVHMIVAARSVRADWESFWASLTFEAPGVK